MSFARSLACFVSAGWVLLAAAAVAFAQAPYRVEDIAVQATAGDAVQAQAMAIDEGQRQGLRQLLQRLAGDAQAMPDLAGLTVDDFVVSFEVDEETVGPTTYAGTIAVTYDREAVNRLLDAEGIAYASEAAAPVTLVPIWETGEGLLLWDSGNAWKAAWDAALDADSLTGFVVPLGDLGDLALADADQVVRGDEAAILALGERYGTDEVVVARLIGSGAPGAPLEVRARRYGAADPAPYEAVVPRTPDEPLSASLERAVREMQAAYEARARQRLAAAAGPRAAVVLRAPVSSLEGWGRLVGYLEDLGGVEIQRVREFSRSEAVLDLRVAGGAEGLREPLERAGWFMSEDPAGGWRLRQGGAPAGSSTL